MAERLPLGINGETGVEHCSLIDLPRPIVTTLKLSMHEIVEVDDDTGIGLILPDNGPIGSVARLVIACDSRISVGKPRRDGTLPDRPDTTPRRYTRLFTTLRPGVRDLFFNNENKYLLHLDNNWGQVAEFTLRSTKSMTVGRLPKQIQFNIIDYFEAKRSNI